MIGFVFTIWALYIFFTALIFWLTVWSESQYDRPTNYMQIFMYSRLWPFWGYMFIIWEGFGYTDYDPKIIGPFIDWTMGEDYA